MPLITYLKYARLKKGFKQKQLAFHLNITHRALRSYESAERRMSKTIAYKLSKALNLTIDPGYTHKIIIHSAEHKKLLPTHPKNSPKKITATKNHPTTIFDILNVQKRKISLKDCHALVLRIN